jgi:hypothetical protein
MCVYKRVVLTCSECGMAAGNQFYEFALGCEDYYRTAIKCIALRTADYEPEKRTTMYSGKTVVCQGRQDLKASKKNKRKGHK